MTASVKQFTDIVSKLDSELHKRDALFPLRDPENDTRVRQLLDEFVKAINDLAEDSPLVPPTLGIDAARVFAEQGVFLCGYMKSGTTLLLELLDGHSQMTALPGDAWFMGRKMLGHEHAALLFGDTLRDRWLSRLVNPTGQAPFWILGHECEPYIRFKHYFDAWLTALGEPQRGHLLSVVLAYASISSKDPAALKWWVEKTPGNEFHVDRILQHFPHARFIHIVRDPRENFASLKKLYETRRWEWNPFGVAGKIGASCRQAYENRARLGPDRYHVLSYESLTENPTRVMEAISKALDIDWDDALLAPTINSIPAKANTMHSDRQVIGTVGPASTDKWKSVLTAAEKRAILCIRKDARHAGYDWGVKQKDYILNALEKIRFRARSNKGDVNEQNRA